MPGYLDKAFTRFKHEAPEKFRTHRIHMSYRNTEQKPSTPRMKTSPPRYPRRRQNTSKPLLEQ